MVDIDELFKQVPLSFDLSRERVTFMICAFLAHEVPLFAYHVICGWLREKDLCREYLIQPDAYPPPSLIQKCNRQILVGHCVVQWVFLYFFYQAFNYLGLAPLSAPWNPVELLYVFPFMVICDTLLYWAHRTLHHPSLYVRMSPSQFLLRLITLQDSTNNIMNFIPMFLLLLNTSVHLKNSLLDLFPL